MTPEEKIKDFKGAKLAYYRVSTVALDFQTLADSFAFHLWLEDNGYSSCLFVSMRVEFIRTPIHQHRIEDARKYPNLKLQGSEVTR